ncbi:10303_t:CDS:1 [Funneliformis geosporum]|uniref:11912_t:CDS:1 n=1 Tax=Funneliformis geosporum TaxID=1117311 RepID=A0A9W4WPX1_9GLOM|nr:11912_t:CDS:1 [Funneliformis geosporum]CAI2179548.1 10303_t:CDS:1 [Funneliformis geosporum]
MTIIHKIIKYNYSICLRQKPQIIFSQISINLIINKFRLFSTSQISNFKKSSNHKPRDEEIKSHYVSYVDLEGQIKGTFPLKKILSEIDRTKYWLVQVSPVQDTSFPSKSSSQQLSKGQQQKELPICRLISKQELYEKQKKQKKTTILKKELLLTWKVSPNDLTHKLSRAKEWLEKGYQLQIVISNRGGKKNQANQDKSLFDRIVKELTEFTKDIKEPIWTNGSVVVEMQGKINIHKDSPADAESTEI